MRDRNAKVRDIFEGKVVNATRVNDKNRMETTYKRKETAP